MAGRRGASPGCSTATGSRCRPGGWPPTPRAAAHAAEELGTRSRSRRRARRSSTRARSARSGPGSRMPTAVARRGGADGRGARRRGPRAGETFLVQAMVEGASRCWSASPAIPPSARCSPAGPAERRPSCIATRRADLPGDGRERRRCSARWRSIPLLTGFRGEPPADLGALEELLLRVSAMVDAHREIVELDLNPVIAGPGGAGGDARIRVARPAARPWPSTWQ